jgi:hypothetical protein
VALHPAANAGRWQQPVGSAPTVAEVGPVGASQEGVISATVCPRRAGTAVISSYAPISRSWWLVLEVVA